MGCSSWLKAARRVPSPWFRRPSSGKHAPSRNRAAYHIRYPASPLATSPAHFLCTELTDYHAKSFDPRPVVRGLQSSHRPSWRPSLASASTAAPRPADHARTAWLSLADRWIRRAVSEAADSLMMLQSSPVQASEREAMIMRGHLPALSDAIAGSSESACQHEEMGKQARAH